MRTQVSIVLAALATSACGPPIHKAIPDPSFVIYPSFEIFESSRMFEALAGDIDQVDLGELAATVLAVDSAVTRSEEAVEKASGRDEIAGPSAELLPKLPEAERPLYCIVPVVFKKLAPLWEAPTLTEAQVLLANQGAKILGSISGVPDVEFHPGEDAKNREGLVQLVRWFHAAVAKPECLAAMIFTMDNGPYVGLPFESTEVLPWRETVLVGPRAKLGLAKVQRAGEPWVLQCVLNGKPTWSRVVSAGSDGEVANVTLGNAQPERLGHYGWHLEFAVEWPAGEEQAHLYLRPNGDLLFYFLSW